jgi:hypothetical protein
MTFQYVRGFAYFRGKTPEEVRAAFRDFKLGFTFQLYFSSLKRYGKEIQEPGIFIAGRFFSHRSSMDIVNILAKRMGVEESSVGRDISVKEEDRIEWLSQGPILKGNYYAGLRVKLPYDFTRVCEKAIEIASQIGANDVLVRTVESENGDPLACIDLITPKNYQRDFETLRFIDEVILTKPTFIHLE